MTTSNPYQAPASDVTSTSDNQPYQPKIFTANGRIGRLRYLADGVISYLCLIPLGLLAGGFGANESGAMGGIALLFLGLGYIAMVVFMFILAKRRLNDLNQSGWLSLLLLIPLVNIFIGLWLIFAPGNKQHNNYGAQPVKNPVGIVILALVMPVLMLGVIAAVSIPAYQDYVERAASYEESLIRE